MEEREFSSDSPLKVALLFSLELLTVYHREAALGVTSLFHQTFYSTLFTDNKRLSLILSLRLDKLLFMKLYKRSGGPFFRSGLDIRLYKVYVCWRRYCSFSRSGCKSFSYNPNWKAYSTFCYLTRKSSIFSIALISVHFGYVGFLRLRALYIRDQPFKSWVRSRALFLLSKTT